jgi:hypothetical protein
MDREAFNSGMTMLQMAFRTEIPAATLRFYFEFLNKKAGASNEIWSKAVDRIIVRGGYRCPSLGDILRDVHQMMTEEGEYDQMERRRHELMALERPTTEQQRRIVDTFIRPLVAKLKA